MYHCGMFPQVALKVIKHCEEEGSSSELVTGFLVGLVVGKTLEITNCFPLPKDLDEPEEESEWVCTFRLVRMGVSLYTTMTSFLVLKQTTIPSYTHIHLYV